MEQAAARSQRWRSTVGSSLGAGRGGATGGLALATAVDGVAEEVLDLAVDAAEFVGGPGLQLAPELGIDPQQE